MSPEAKVKWNLFALVTEEGLGYGDRTNAAKTITGHNADAADRETNRRQVRYFNA